MDVLVAAIVAAAVVAGGRFITRRRWDGIAVSITAFPSAIRHLGRESILVMATLAVALLNTPGGLGWAETVTGHDIPEQWVFPVTTLVLGAVMLWRLLVIHARNDTQAARSEAIGVLDLLLAGIRGHLILFRNSQARADFLSQQDLSLHDRDQLLDQRYGEANAAADEIIRLLDQIRRYVDGQPLIGPAGRSEFDLVTRRHQTMTIEDRATAAMELVTRFMRDLRDGAIPR